MTIFKLNVINDDGATVCHEVRLAASEIEVFERFVLDAEKLWNTKWVQGGFDSGMKLNYSQGSGMTVDARLPPDEEVAGFLHMLRPFQLEKEDTHYPKVSSTLGRHIEDDAVRRALKAERQSFLGQLVQKEIMQFKANGVVINCEATLNKWLNAYEYHRDQGKRREIEALHVMFPLDASKVLFLRQLRDKAIAIKRLADFISLLLHGGGDIIIGPRQDGRTAKGGN